MLKETQNANGYYLDNTETGETTLSAWKMGFNLWGVDFASRYFEVTSEELATFVQMVKRAGN